MLGNIPGTDVFRDLHHYNESAVSVPGFLIVSIEAAINFANTTYLNERLVVDCFFDSILGLFLLYFFSLFEQFSLLYVNVYEGF